MGLIRNYGPTLLYLRFKNTNPDKKIGVSNLRYEIGKATIYKFGNNVKDLPDDMSSDHSIIFDKGELHEDYVCHIYRDLLSGENSAFNSFIGTQE